PGRYKWLVDTLLGRDEYFHLADLGAYVDVQERVSEEYLERDDWTRKAIRNVARIGKFSSDRAVREYASEIWNLKSYADEAAHGSEAPRARGAEDGGPGARPSRPALNA